MMVIPKNNPGASIGDPRQEFYVREDKNDALFGPLTYQHANAQARELSEDEDKSGLAEIVTYVGARPGDPVGNATELRVVYMYIRGKQTLGGRTAQFHSDRQLPPTA
jgi:hypothetical protein